MTGCVEWAGSIDNKGYGRQWFQGRNQLAHRVAWMQVNGPVPRGLHVLHHCDNPPCINVEHLFLGTHQDNMDDMYAKGRKAILAGDDHWSHREPARITRGSAHGMSRLTEADIPVIRARRAQGETLQAIAATYGIAFQNIWAVVKGKTWRHIP